MIDPVPGGGARGLHGATERAAPLAGHSVTRQAGGAAVPVALPLALPVRADDPQDVPGRVLNLKADTDSESRPVPTENCATGEFKFNATASCFQAGEPDYQMP